MVTFISKKIEKMNRTCEEMHRDNRMLEENYHQAVLNIRALEDRIVVLVKNKENTDGLVNK